MKRLIHRFVRVPVRGSIAVATAAIAAIAFVAPRAEPTVLPDAVTLSGDARGGYYTLETRPRDGGDHQRIEDLRVRLRLGVRVALGEEASVKARLAGRFSTGPHETRFVFDDHLDRRDGLPMGYSTFDELHVDFGRLPEWRLRAGRMQVRLGSYGFGSRSLDRADSTNSEITWTDGFHLTRFGAEDWEGHVVLQYNSPRGPGNTLREPLDFSGSGSRWTYYAGVEQRSDSGWLRQKGLGVTWIPGSLPRHGDPDGRRDYLALVARGGAEWPVGERTRIELGAQLGYAPMTPARSLTIGGGSESAGGLAALAAVGLVDFIPGHGAGIVAGVAEDGWLLSPDFRSNVRQVELRYEWQPAPRHELSLRLRQRDDLKEHSQAVRRRRDVDFYARWNVRF